MTSYGNALASLISVNLMYASNVSLFSKVQLLHDMEAESRAVEAEQLYTQWQDEHWHIRICPDLYLVFCFSFRE